jgi:hydrogenase maturation protein HypF
MHPDYLATRYALRAGAEREGLAGYVERPAPPRPHRRRHGRARPDRATAPVIGVAFDGTGYGDDGAIWGGEFLVAGYARLSTASAHLRYVHPARRRPRRARAVAHGPGLARLDRAAVGR